MGVVGPKKLQEHICRSAAPGESWAAGEGGEQGAVTQAGFLAARLREALPGESGRESGDSCPPDEGSGSGALGAIRIGVNRIVASSCVHQRERVEERAGSDLGPPEPEKLS
ncbi:hypothetical protein H2248_002984 [Termitomyces sp. 'cryptogamus']|nr:hypothetical protein H2248_002984 [Termitomyces sp. 'cryptogamus']